MIKSGYNSLSESANSDAILENFKNVLESAYDTYGDINESHDFIGICLNELDNNSFEFINESISTQNYLDSMNESKVLNEDGTNVCNAKIVKEKRGTGLSVMINGKEYRYVSPSKSTEDLYRSFNGMLKHANSGYKALNWLKKNALCYYGYCSASEEGKKLVGNE